MPHVAGTRTGPSSARQPPDPAGRRRVDAETVDVLHRAAQVLLDDLPSLTDRLVAALREQESAYRAAIETDRAEVWHEVHRSLRHNVASLLRPAEQRDAARRTSRTIGASRAEQGVPLDAVLHAFRIGGAMVWQDLVDETARRDPEAVRLLVHVASLVWHYVDEHCGLVTEGYRQTERRIAWRRANRGRLLAAALLDGSARIADVPAAADELGLPEHGRYAVVAVISPRAGTGGSAPPEPDQHAPVALPSGTTAVWHLSATAEQAIVLLADREVPAARGGPAAALARDLHAPPGVRVGVSRAVTGLAALGEARRLAEIALGTCPRGGGVALLDDHLPAALTVSSPALGSALAERVLGPLDAVDPADRDVLITTVTAWFEADGSARGAGERLYCHRNTVLNRLRRFEQLTGRSLARPGDAVEISLALTAHRLLDT